MHDRLKHVKETLMCAVEGQICNLDKVDAKELGEAVDMIKDLEEALYYCTITKAMEEGKDQEHYSNSEEKHFREKYPYRDPYLERDMDKMNGRMYYPYDYNRMYYPMDTMYYDGRGGNTSGSSGNNSSSSGTSRNFSERELPMEMMRDYREGRSSKNRKMYMEAKETNQEKSVQMHELEKYMQELSSDIVEMIGDASAEEKQFLEKKLSTLASKVGQMK